MFTVTGLKNFWVYNSAVKSTSILDKNWSDFNLDLESSHENTERFLLLERCSCSHTLTVHNGRDSHRKADIC